MTSSSRSSSATSSPSHLTQAYMLLHTLKQEQSRINQKKNKKKQSNNNDVNSSSNEEMKSPSDLPSEEGKSLSSPTRSSPPSRASRSSSSLSSSSSSSGSSAESSDDEDASEGDEASLDPSHLEAEIDRLTQLLSRHRAASPSTHYSLSYFDGLVAGMIASVVAAYCHVFFAVRGASRYVDNVCNILLLQWLFYRVKSLFLSVLHHPYVQYAPKIRIAHAVVYSQTLMQFCKGAEEETTWRRDMQQFDLLMSVQTPHSVFAFLCSLSLNNVVALLQHSALHPPLDAQDQDEAQTNNMRNIIVQLQQHIQQQDHVIRQYIDRNHSSISSKSLHSLHKSASTPKSTNASSSSSSSSSNSSSSSPVALPALSYSPPDDLLADNKQLRTLLKSQEQQLLAQEAVMHRLSEEIQQLNQKVFELEDKKHEREEIEIK